MTKKSRSVTKNILIIEDETMLLEALVAKVTSAGFTVRGCTNARDAFKLIEKQKPNLILTDLVMSTVDGFEILTMLKDNFHYREIPVFVLTNLMEGEDSERAKALGVDDFIIKSETSLEEIVNKVKRVLKP